MVINTTPPVYLNTNAKVAVAPFINDTSISFAGGRAAAIAVKTLTSRGYTHLEAYSSKQTNNKASCCINHEIPYEQQIKWAQHVGATYMLTGSISNWDNLAVIGCKPLVSVTIQLVDVAAGRTVWTAKGSRRGDPSIVLAMIVQELTHSMLLRMCATAPKSPCGKV